MESVMRNKESTIALVSMCQDIKNKIGKEDITIVEIGSYMGESSVIFAEQFPKGKIICVDPWVSGYDDSDSASEADYSEVEAVFDLRIKNYDNIFKVKSYSLDYSKDCDICYLDGCHKYSSVKEDVKHWLPQVSFAIAGHDYVKNEAFLELHPHIKGVGIAINELLGNPDTIYGEDGNWIKYK